MNVTNPTILFVPGSFAPPTIYAATIAHMRNLGFPSVALELPSTVKRMPLAPATMLDDASVITRAVETILSQGKEVVVVSHSYGGTPMSQALVGLDVKRMIYVTAIAPKVGQNQVQALGAEVLPMEEVGGYMHLDAVAFAANTCNDLPWELAYEATLNFAHHSASSFLQPVTQVAYADGKIPVSYVVTEKDLVVPVAAQRGFIKVIEEASGRNVSVVSLESSHCPNWSIPERLGDVIVAETQKEDEW
ncbi:alpha/beta-hydrolase [Ophiobolus disseminans]|uniref:Alpha/beta-hydrolase n=1 Tax=Ophiobolus disseminans TaxID=1469910 RepID=A0A6A7AEJ7_9PLEO|nr:alpha/beta-hydrolase [Ophiobolus disseminans]